MTTEQRRHNAGFTLIELMIVVAIIGVLGSVATAAYSDYVNTSQAQAMSANYELAVDRAQQNYVAARSFVINGAPINTIIPGDSAGWVALLNGSNSRAPGGGDAYLAGGGDGVTGAIGVTFAGSYANRDSTVTITRPAFAGLTVQTTVIDQRDF